MRPARLLTVFALSHLIFSLMGFTATYAAASVGSISGTISYSGSQTGAILVGVFSSPVSCAGTNSQPSATVQLSVLGGYTISSLPDGTYYAASVILTGGSDSSPLLTDPWGIYGSCVSNIPIVISGGSSVRNINIQLSDGTSSNPNPFYHKYSFYGYSHHDQSGYSIRINVGDINDTATSVTVSGLGFSGTAAMLYEASWQHWELDASFGMSPPALPQTYDILVTDASGTAHGQVSIQAYVSEFVSNLVPLDGQSVYGNPVFTWTGVPGNYTFGVEVLNLDYSPVWTTYGITTTTVVYDGQSLIKGNTYILEVIVTDQYGDEASVYHNFVYAGQETGGLWQNASSLGSGWKWLSWFGYFNTNNSPWIYHTTLGWLYPFGTSTDSIWFWDVGMNTFWWTSATVYPFMWSQRRRAGFTIMVRKNGRWIKKTPGSRLCKKARSMVDYYLNKPSSRCAKLVQRALEGNPDALNIIQDYPSYCH